MKLFWNHFGRMILYFIHSIKKACSKTYLLKIKYYRSDPTKHKPFHSKLLRLMKSIIRDHSSDWVTLHENIKNPMHTWRKLRKMLRRRLLHSIYVLCPARRIITTQTSACIHHKIKTTARIITTYKITKNFKIINATIIQIHNNGGSL